MIIWIGQAVKDWLANFRRMRANRDVFRVEDPYKRTDEQALCYEEKRESSNPCNGEGNCRSRDVNAVP